MQSDICYQVVAVCDEVEKLVERVRPLRDDLGLEIAEQDFLGKLESSIQETNIKEKVVRLVVHLLLRLMMQGE